MSSPIKTSIRKKAGQVTGTCVQRKLELRLRSAMDDPIIEKLSPRVLAHKLKSNNKVAVLELNFKGNEGCSKLPRR
jgi:hypothetical protein